MTRASIVSALALSLGLLSSGCGGGTPKVEFTAVSPLMVSGGCATGSTCHGATQGMVSGKTNRLKFVVGMDAANCASAAALIDKTTPASSRLAVYAYDAGHMGNGSTGWETASSAGPKAVVEWATGGGACP